MEQTEKKPGYSLVDYVRILQRQWKWIVLIFLVLFVPMAIISWLQPEQYTATAKILFEHDRRRNIKLTTVLSARDVMRVMPVEKLNSLAETLTSGSLLAEVVAKLDLARTPEEIERETTRIANRLKAQVLPSSSIIRLTYNDSDPEMAKRVLNTLLEAFQRFYLKFVEGDEAMAFNRTEFEFVDDRIKRNVAALNTIRNEVGIDGYYRNEYRTVLTQLKTNQERLAKNELLLGRNVATVRALQRQLSQTPARVKASVDLVPNEERTNLERDLQTLISQKDEMRVRYTENNPAVKRKLMEIAALERRIADLPAVSEGRTVMKVNPAYDELEAKLTKARADVDESSFANEELRRTIKQINQHLSDLRRVEYQVVELEEAIDADLKARGNYRDRLTDARFIERMNDENILSATVIQDAVTPAAVGVRYKFTGLSWLLSAILAVAIVVAWELLREWYRPKVKNPEELSELLKVPVLATVSDHSRRKTA